MPGRRRGAGNVFIDREVCGQLVQQLREDRRLGRGEGKGEHVSQEGLGQEPSASDLRVQVQRLRVDGERGRVERAVGRDADFCVALDLEGLEVVL